MAALPPFVDPRRLLAKHGLTPKRRFSQNFLVARPVVEAIAEAATLQRPAHLLELGPGLGTLTLELMRRCPHVLAIEPDADMLRVLASELVPLGLSTRRGDATELDYHALRQELGGVDLQLAGNLPYAVTGAILRNIVDQRSAVARAVLMLQREVRDRLIARPGTRQWGALSVFVSIGYSIETVVHVPATAFVPRPKVSSSVICLQRRDTPRVVETGTLRNVVRAIFQQRRKTLRNALGSLGSAQQVRAALQACAIDGGLRGETLEVEELAALADALDAAGS